MAFLDFNLQFTPKTGIKWLFLKLVSCLYGTILSCWLFLYRSNLKKSYEPGKKLISVGNITMGGTGKTPMIDWLLRFCNSRKINAVVLTRGYKAERVEDIQILNHKTANQGNSRQFGDEPWMLFKRHPQTTFYIGPDRVKSAKIAEAEADLILLDDGMQHLRIARHLNLVLIDSHAKIGNGRLFPLGPLREPLKSLNRADAIIYTRTNLASPSEVQKEIEAYLLPGTPQFKTSLLPQRLISSKNNNSKTVSDLSGKRALLFSGIGNPASFQMTIEQLGCSVTNHLVLDDHTSYNPSNLEKLNNFFNDNQTVDLAICTEKDWVKLEEFRNHLPEFWYLQMELSVDEGFEEYLTSQLEPDY